MTTTDTALHDRMICSVYIVKRIYVFFVKHMKQGIAQKCMAGSDDESKIENNDGGSITLWSSLVSYNPWAFA